MKLSLKNFQVHGSLSLDIGGFTVIEGSSSVGKSSIRRAIQCLLYSQYDKSYLRVGASCLSVGLDDGLTSIGYFRPENSYVVNGKKFDHVGRGGVPAELVESGFRKVVIGEDEYDVIVSSQLDPLFVTSFKSSEVTRLLGRLFRVERYELAGKLVQADLMSLKVANTRMQGELDSLRDKIDSLSVVELDVDRLRVDMESLEVLRGYFGCVDELSILSDRVSRDDVVLAECRRCVVLMRDSAVVSGYLSTYLDHKFLLDRMTVLNEALFASGQLLADVSGLSLVDGYLSDLCLFGVYSDLRVILGSLLVDLNRFKCLLVYLSDLSGVSGIESRVAFLISSLDEARVVRSSFDGSVCVSCGRVI